VSGKDQRSRSGLVTSSDSPHVPNAEVLWTAIEAFAQKTEGIQPISDQVQASSVVWSDRPSGDQLFGELQRP
jgi:hypothetical protein